MAGSFLGLQRQKELGSLSWTQQCFNGRRFWDTSQVSLRLWDMSSGREVGCEAVCKALSFARVAAHQAAVDSEWWHCRFLLVGQPLVDFPQLLFLTAFADDVIGPLTLRLSNQPPLLSFQFVGCVEKFQVTTAFPGLKEGFLTF